MCGRYYIETGTWDAVGKDFPYLKRNELSVSAGDITPAMESGALILDGTELQAEMLKWGYPGFKGSGLIINARAEGIYDKPLFSDGIRNRRCVLPAAGFYEWDRSKQRVQFTLQYNPVIYLAGIFRPYGEVLHFVIITREANASMQPVHDRMPLMIAKENVKDWTAILQRQKNCSRTLCLNLRQKGNTNNSRSFNFEYCSIKIATYKGRYY